MRQKLCDDKQCEKYKNINSSAPLTVFVMHLFVLCSLVGLVILIGMCDDYYALSKADPGWMALFLLAFHFMLTVLLDCLQCYSWSYTQLLLACTCVSVANEHSLTWWLKKLSAHSF